MTEGCLAVLGCLGLEQQISWNLHLQILAQLKWLLSRSGSDREVPRRRELQLPRQGELSVDVFVTSLLMAEDLFHIQKPGYYITPCPADTFYQNRWSSL